MASERDRANRLAWGNRDVVELFVEREGFSSNAEAHLMRRVASEAKDQPILDIGVGGGRTVASLRSVSADYVGIDYLGELVHATRRRYPDARVEHMDARDLGAFADQTFALVVFSRNGIDSADHDDRPRILGEIHRVLRPGGLLAYSTHNLDHRSTGRPHLHVDWGRISKRPGSAIRQIARLPSSIGDYWRLRRLNAGGEGWASIATFGYGHAVSWHHVTFTEAVRELLDAGFTTVQLYGADGVRATVDAGSAPPGARGHTADTAGSPTLHLLARKPPSAGHP